MTIAALSLEETVVATLDRVAGWPVRILLQSVETPDLGLTVLRWNDGRLTGGDEACARGPNSS